MGERDGLGIRHTEAKGEVEIKKGVRIKTGRGGQEEMLTTA